MGVRGGEEAVREEVDVVGDGLGLVGEGRPPGRAEGEDPGALLLELDGPAGHAAEEEEGGGAEPELGVEEAAAHGVEEQADGVGQRGEYDGHGGVVAVGGLVLLQALARAGERLDAVDGDEVDAGWSTVTSLKGSRGSTQGNTHRNSTSTTTTASATASSVFTPRDPGRRRHSHAYTATPTRPA